MKYIIITPIRDEADTLVETINSVSNQTILPIEWLFVDDNSNDDTLIILKEYSQKYSFLRFVKINQLTTRAPGQGVIRAFNYGVKNLQIKNYDFIVKLDADMKFDSNYFEKLFNEFNKNPKLGIASSLILENNSMQPYKKHYHEITTGCAKVYKRLCFEKIMPIEEIKGWDFLDNIQAMYNGFDTKIIKHIKAFHLKPLDQAVGYQRENYLKGYYDAYLNYSLLFVIVKGLKKLVLEKPIVINGYFYFYGFFKNLLVDNKFYRNKKINSYIRSYQYKRLKELFLLKKDLYY